jgi:hypothetical protein
MEITNNYGKPRYFKFKITNPGKNDGFIDAMQVHEYVDFEKSKDGTYEQYLAKAMGYIRWCNICTLLSNYGIFFMEVDKLEGATSVDAPTSIEFTIGYEQTDALRVNLDGNIFEGSDALKLILQKALTLQYKSFVRFYNPTILPTSNEVDATAPVGFEDISVIAPAVCESELISMKCIHVEEIPTPDFNKNIEF